MQEALPKVNRMPPIVKSLPISRSHHQQYQLSNTAIISAKKQQNNKSVQKVILKVKDKEQSILPQGINFFERSKEKNQQQKCQKEKTDKKQTFTDQQKQKINQVYQKSAQNQLIDKKEIKQKKQNIRNIQKQISNHKLNKQQSQNTQEISEKEIGQIQTARKDCFKRQLTSQSQEQIKNTNIKFLIKRVRTLERKVQAKQIRQIQKKQYIGIQNNNKIKKQMKIRSNIISIKLENQNEQNFAQQLKKLKQKVQDLANKSQIYNSRAVVTGSDKNLVQNSPSIQNAITSNSPNKQIQRNQQKKQKSIKIDCGWLQPTAFIRSKPQNNFQYQSSRQVIQYPQQYSQKMLQFNPQKQKFMLQSINTEQMRSTQQNIIKHRHSNPSNQQLIDYNQLLQSLPPFPQFPPMPALDASQQEIICLGQHLFSLLGVKGAVALRVKKYKNCLWFGVSGEDNILWHRDGRVYYGGWKVHSNAEGEKWGQGREYQSNHYYYQGMFRCNKREGQGVLHHIKNRTIYVGQFSGGVKHGRGRQYDSEGGHYQGEYQQNKREGYGRYVTALEEYEGTFKGGLKWGHGVEKFKNGDYYKGEYVEGKFQGKGYYRWGNQSSYQGEFKGGKRDGIGIWRLEEEGDMYEGSYQNDLKHGPGIYKWSNGTVFSGEFKNDKKNGKGTLKYPNGKIMKLQWENGQVIKKLQHNEIIQSIPRKIMMQRKQQTKRNTQSSQFRIMKQFGRQTTIQSKPSLTNVKRSSMNSGKSSLSRPQFQQKSQSVFSKAFSRVGTPINTTLQSNKTLGRHQKNAFPQDPPYKGLRSSTNIITF